MRPNAVGRRQSSEEGARHEGPQGSPRPLRQDQGPSSGRDGGYVLNLTEGSSEVSRGHAGLENGEHVWEGRLKDREMGSRTAVSPGPRNTAEMGGVYGGGQGQRRPAPKQPPGCLPSLAGGWGPFLPPRPLSPSGPRSPGRRLPSRRVPQSPFVLPTVRPPPLPSVAQVWVWLRGAVSLTVMHLGHEKESPAQWAARRGAARPRRSWRRGPLLCLGAAPPRGL